jgi:uncharacterized protein YecE (DUF72 family)
VGCAIWANKGWAYNFFPEKTKAADFLREYSHRLTTVEDSTTFYTVPAAETVVRRAEQSPPGFQFCMKLPTTITHVRRFWAHSRIPSCFLSAWAAWATGSGRFSSNYHPVSPPLIRPFCPIFSAYFSPHFAYMSACAVAAGLRQRCGPG